MNELFVPYELAVKLKVKGFNEQCFGIYYKKEFKLADFISMPYVNNDEVSDVIFTAPLWQQAIAWLREEKGIWISIDWHRESNTFCVNNSGTWYKSYNEALQSGIEKALELI